MKDTHRAPNSNGGSPLRHDAPGMYGTRPRLLYVRLSGTQISRYVQNGVRRRSRREGSFLVGVRRWWGGLSPRSRPVAAIGAALVVMLTVSAAVVIFRSKSPQEMALAAAPPDLTLLSEPVRKQVLTSTLITRGDVTTPDVASVACKPGTSGEGVTGEVFTQPPQYGTELPEGGVLAGVNGRPVFVLQGELPMFREITPGVSGDDVKQLQAALARLGLKPGAINGVFHSGTQDAMKRLYERGGYQPADQDGAASDASPLDSAKESLASAEAEQRSAEAALAAAKQGPDPLDVAEARLAVTEAEQAHAEAKNSDAPATEVERAHIAVQRAQQQLKALTAAPNTAAEQQAVTDAKARVKQAQENLAVISSRTGMSIPFCEIVFAPSVPVTPTAARNTNSGFDSASAADPNGNAGGAGGQSWVTLNSGALVLKATVSARDAEFVSEGTTVRYGDAAEPSQGTITAITEPSPTDSSGQWALTITPTEPLGADRLGDNVKVVADLESTGGEVLTVPLAALTGTADGAAKVRVVTGTGDDATTRDVPVTPGLAADGYVEVTPRTPGDLTDTDHVALGQ